MPLNLSSGLVVTLVLLATVATAGCIETDVASQILDALMPEEQIRPEKVTLDTQSGDFAPDPEMDQDELQEAFTELIANPTNAPAVFQGLSWRHSLHKFNLPENGHNLQFFVDIEWLNLNQPNYMGGTVEVVVYDPDGEVCQRCDRNETQLPAYLGQQNPPIQIIIVPPTPKPGEWVVDISGSGADGALKNLYSGSYEITAKAEIIVPAKS